MHPRRRRHLALVIGSERESAGNNWEAYKILQAHTMPEPIFVIDDSFFIKGRGLALVSTWERGDGPPVNVKVGDEVELTTPGGETFRTQVKGVEMIHADPSLPHLTPLGILVSLPAEYGVRLCGAKAQVVTEKAKS